MARIGLLGGSFNPAHRGHRAISLHAMSALGLDEVWWLVSPGNPLKQRAKDMAPFDARLASAKISSRAAGPPCEGDTGSSPSIRASATRPRPPIAPRNSGRNAAFWSSNSRRVSSSPLAW